MSASVDYLITNFQIRFREAVSRDNEPVTAVLRSLPTDPQERQIVLDEFDHHPDERFEIEVLGALAQFKHKPEKVREARARLGLDWRTHVDHPDVFSRKDQDTLDVLQDTSPIGDNTFKEWIEHAVQKGLLDEEHMKHLLT